MLDAWEDAMQRKVPRFNVQLRAQHWFLPTQLQMC